MLLAIYPTDGIYLAGRYGLIAANAGTVYIESGCSKQGIEYPAQHSKHDQATYPALTPLPEFQCGRKR